MNDHNIGTIQQVRQFLTGAESINLNIESREARYAWVQQTLTRLKYQQLNEKLYNYQHVTT